jgi:hypothetical protein
MARTAWIYPRVEPSAASCARRYVSLVGVTGPSNPGGQLRDVFTERKQVQPSACIGSTGIPVDDRGGRYGKTRGLTQAVATVKVEP